MTSVVTTNAGLPALSEDDLALMSGDRSTRAFDQKDLVTPQLRIVQATSGYAKRSHADFIAEAREGDFIDTLTKTLRATARVIICEEAVTYTEWKPNQGPLVKQWGRDSSGYDAAEGDYGTRQTAEGNEIGPAETYYALLLTDEDGASMPVVMYLTGTQYRKGRRLNTLLTTFELKGPDGPFTAPFYARVFDCSTVPESNDQGSWMGWKIEPGPLTLTVPGGRALYQKAKLFAESVTRGEVQAAPPAERATPAADGTEGSTRRAHGNGTAPATEADDIPF